MPMPDFFNNDAFSEISLTESINKQPVVRGRLARHFQFKGIRTTTAAVEEREGTLRLIPKGTRGVPGTEIEKRRRKVRKFDIPHLPHEGKVLAADLQDVRSFGTEDQLESVAEAVDEVLEQLAADHEATWEHMRAGAINGLMKDADGTTTLFNFYTEFGVTEQVIDFDFTDADDPRKKAMEVDRTVEDQLGATPYSGLTAYCGDQFWDEFITHSSVKDAWQRYQDGQWSRQDGRRGFVLWGIRWEEYRAKLGSYYYMDRDIARVVPEGRNLFGWTAAPADTMTYVNTKGKRMYVTKEKIKGDKGWDIMSQSNPFFYPKRPGANIKITMTT